MALDLELDLVEIQPNVDPPVCRIMDFGKFRFEQQKKASAAKKKQKQVELKELKFRPTTDVGDYAIKLRNIRRFLEEGDKVKINIRFKGREMAHQELGLAMAAKIETDLGDEVVIEQRPRRSSRSETPREAPGLQPPGSRAFHTRAGCAGCARGHAVHGRGRGGLESATVHPGSPGVCRSRQFGGRRPGGAAMHSPGPWVPLVGQQPEVG
jgi:translation initiation factor IF-3